MCAMTVRIKERSLKFTFPPPATEPINEPSLTTLKDAFSRFHAEVFFSKSTGIDMSIGKEVSIKYFFRKIKYHG